MHEKDFQISLQQTKTLRTIVLRLKATVKPGNPNQWVMSASCTLRFKPKIFYSGWRCFQNN